MEHRPYIDRSRMIGLKVSRELPVLPSARYQLDIAVDMRKESRAHWRFFPYIALYAGTSVSSGASDGVVKNTEGHLDPLFLILAHAAAALQSGLKGAVTRKGAVPPGAEGIIPGSG